MADRDPSRMGLSWLEIAEFAEDSKGTTHKWVALAIQRALALQRSRIVGELRREAARLEAGGGLEDGSAEFVYVSDTAADALERAAHRLEAESDG